ncbi:preprotein translocase subunit SecE [Mycoplasmopsis cricetuli]|uniref:preprotein translocase subunit SecE n=1 Tax=Mycoplasmopsis cricetuli TaxID=171283 RepID=UPI000685D2B2|nr:preprotein translocase subunit SecE [Mycoplasmopsis cricetuli]
MKNKQTKPKKYLIRKFIREIKRVKWPSNQTNVISLIKIFVFTLILAGFVIAITLLFTHIWTINSLN